MASKLDGEFSSFAPLDEGVDPYIISASTTTANIAIAPGNYVVFLKGADPFTLLFLKLGTSNEVTVAAVTAGNHAAGTICLRGDMVERIIIGPSYTHIAAILSSGATTADLVLQKLA